MSCAMRSRMTFGFVSRSRSKEATVRIPPCLIPARVSRHPPTCFADENARGGGGEGGTHSSSSEVNSRPPTVRIDKGTPNHRTDGETQERRDDRHRHDLAAVLQRHDVSHRARADGVGGRGGTSRDEAEGNEGHQVGRPRRGQRRDGEDDVGGVVDAEAAKDLGERAQDAFGCFACTSVTLFSVVVSSSPFGQTNLQWSDPPPQRVDGDGHDPEQLARVVELA